MEPGSAQESLMEKSVQYSYVLKVTMFLVCNNIFNDYIYTNFVVVYSQHMTHAQARTLEILRTDTTCGLPHASLSKETLNNLRKQGEYVKRSETRKSSTSTTLNAYISKRQGLVTAVK